MPHINKYRSYVCNSFIKLTDDDRVNNTDIIEEAENDTVILRLDGYAVVPKEEYEELLETKKHQALIPTWIACFRKKFNRNY